MKRYWLAILSAAYITCALADPAVEPQYANPTIVSPAEAETIGLVVRMEQSDHSSTYVTIAIDPEFYSSAEKCLEFSNLGMVDESGVPLFVMGSYIQALISATESGAVQLGMLEIKHGHELRISLDFRSGCELIVADTYQLVLVAE